MKRPYRLGGAVGVLLLWQVQGSQAQLLDQAIDPNIPGFQAEPGVTVTSRQRPDYDYRGIRVGSFMIRPEVSESAGYDSNVTGTSTPHGSSLARTQVAVQAISDLPRYGLSAGLSLDDFRYLDQPRQSLTNWTAYLGGTYDFGRDTVSLGYAHLNLNQSPRDLDTPMLDQAIAYRVDTVRVNYRTSFNRVWLRPELAVSHYDFDNGTVAGAPYLQNYRNRTVVTPGIVAGYELAPRRNLVLVVRNVIANYETAAAGFPKRDFNDASVLAGIDYDGGGLWRYRVVAGYDVRTFTNAAYKTIQAPVVEGTAIFSPTGLTTVTGIVARRIQDSADETTAGFTETSARLTVDHEYLRNVLLKAQAGVALNSYSQNGGDQVLYTAGAGATWLLNRNMRLGANYDFFTRQSSGAMASRVSQGFNIGSSFSESRYLLQLRIGL